MDGELLNIENQTLHGILISATHSSSSTWSIRSSGRRLKQAAFRIPAEVDAAACQGIGQENGFAGCCGGRRPRSFWCVPPSASGGPLGGSVQSHVIYEPPHWSTLAVSRWCCPSPQSSASGSVAAVLHICKSVENAPNPFLDRQMPEFYAHHTLVGLSRDNVFPPFGFCGKVCIQYASAHVHACLSNHVASAFLK